MRQKRTKSNKTNTKSTTVPALHNSINRTLSQPKNTKSSLLSHKLERAETTNNSPQQSEQPLKETQRKHDQKHIKLPHFLIEPKNPAKATPFPIHLAQPAARTYTTKQAARHESKKQKITLSLPSTKSPSKSNCFH